MSMNHGLFRAFLALGDESNSFPLSKGDKPCLSTIDFKTFVYYNGHRIITKEGTHLFQCKDLKTLSSLSKLKLLAGSNGLHKGIRWVYKAESLHLSKWVHGGELLIISKLVTLDANFDLNSILEEAIQLNMSGALLLIGPNYVEKISKDTIHMCNRCDFPLFAIPWDLPLVDFFEEIGHAITNSNFNQNNWNDIIFSIIFENNISTNHLRLQAADAEYSLEGFQRFFLIHFTQQDLGQTADAQSSISMDIQEYTKKIFKEAGFPILTSIYSNHIIGLLSNENTCDITPVLEQIVAYISSSYTQLVCNIGIGLPTPDINRLKQSYEQAAECITFSMKRQLKQKIVSYDELGLYQLFSDIKTIEKLDNYVSYQIGNLISYDMENNTQLIETLYVYLQNNCNLLHTADAMYTHRNTIKYRLSRIQEILGCNLKDAAVRLNLHVALYIHKFIL